MANAQHTSKSSESTALARPGTAAAKKDGKAEKPAAAPRVNTKPWEDLPATPSLQKPPREKTTLWVVIELTKRAEGATEEEIKAAFGTMIDPSQTHHDPRAVMRFMSKNRGWGFRMVKSGQHEGRIRLVSEETK